MGSRRGECGSPGRGRETPRVAPPRGVPEERLLAGETRRVVEQAIAALRENQRAVITLRDVEGLSVELVTDYLEGAMDPGLHASFEAHLAGCSHCTHYLEQIEATIRVAGTIRADDLSPELRAGLLKAFQDFNR